MSETSEIAEERADATESELDVYTESRHLRVTFKRDVGHYSEWNLTTAAGWKLHFDAQEDGLLSFVLGGRGYTREVRAGFHYRITSAGIDETDGPDSKLEWATDLTKPKATVGFDCQWGEEFETW